MHRRTAIGTILCGAAFGLPKSSAFPAPSPNSDIPPPELQAMAAVAEDYRRSFDVPGLSVAIAQNGRFVYQQAFGTTGHNSTEPLTTLNLFRIASVSKPITSVAIFHLVEQGSLRTNDLVFGKSGILGTDYGKLPYSPGVDQITIHHLLTHTCGGWSNRADDPMFNHLAMNHSELISWSLQNLPLQSPPGTTFAYSNFGYCLLGRVIEKITGKPYADYVQSAILSPCGITDMRIAGNTLQDRATNEVTYFAQGQEYYDDPYQLNVHRMDSHGGWIATPTDLVKFATHVDGFDPSRNILQPETIRKMVTPTTANPRYASGWNVNSAGHWWHLGDLGGTTALLVRTSTRFSWAALVNTRRENSDDALDDLLWNMVSKVSAWKSALA